MFYLFLFRFLYDGDNLYSRYDKQQKLGTFVTNVPEYWINLSAKFKSKIRCKFMRFLPITAKTFIKVKSRFSSIYFYYEPINI